MNKKTVLVTGASSGIGRQTAIKLQESGYTVYAGARRIEKLKELESFGIHTLVLDVSDEDSMIKCVKAIYDKESSIDVLINCAGYGSYGAIEDVPMEEARRQFDVNVFGLARLVQLVTPKMRENHYGKIVNITSMGGKIWTKFGGWYHSTKFAVEGLSDCLRIELEPFGIDVIVVEPGGIKTDWGIIAAENLKQTARGGSYEKAADAAANGMVKYYSGKWLSKTDLIAKTILKAVTTKRPRTRYLVGFMAKPMVVLKRLLGDRMYDRIIRVLT